MQARRMEEGASAYSVRQLHNMESQHRSHLLRETQAHINELKAEIRQHKTQRSARLIKVLSSVVIFVLHFLVLNLIMLLF